MYVQRGITHQISNCLWSEAANVIEEEQLVCHGLSSCNGVCVPACTRIKFTCIIRLLMVTIGIVNGYVSVCIGAYVRVPVLCIWLAL